MRVAFFVNEFPSASLTFVNNQMTGLIDRGCEVHVFANRPEGAPLVHEDVRNYRILDRTHYWPQPNRAGTVEATLRYAGLLGRRVMAVVSEQGKDPGSEMNFALEPDPVLKASNFLFELPKPELQGWLRKATTVAGLERFDALVCHGGAVGIVAQKLRDMGVLRAPLLTFFHGSDVSRHQEKTGADGYSELYSKCDWVAPVSEHWQRLLVAQGCPPERTAVHRMGIDLKRIAFKPRLVEEGEVPQLVTVARFTEKKGIPYALRALAKVREHGKPFHYHLVGDGERRREIEQLISDLDLASCVTLHGWKAQRAVAGLLESAHLFLLPSVTAADGDQEGIPVSLMEAMAAGIPVVSTHHAGIPELVHHGEGELLVPERDEEALAECLLRLLDAPETWAELGRAGRKVVETECDIDNLNDSLFNRLEELVKEGAYC